MLETSWKIAQIQVPVELSLKVILNKSAHREYPPAHGVLVSCLLMLDLAKVLVCQSQETALCCQLIQKRRIGGLRPLLHIGTSGEALKKILMLRSHATLI